MKSIILSVLISTLIIANCNFKDSTTSLDSYKVIASIPDKDITLYGKQVGYAYSSMILKNGHKYKNFNWCHSDRCGCFPELILSDIDNDGIDELIVIRTEGYGSGMHGGVINILELNTMDEINIINPIDIVNDNVTFELTPDNLNIKIREKHYLLKTDCHTRVKDNLFITNGWAIHYYVEDNKITSTVSCNLRHSAWLGNYVITYQYNNNQLILDDIIFREEKGNFECG